MEKLQQHTINKDEPVITITGLYKSFEDLEVLKGIDLTLYRGENVAILRSNKNHCGFAETR
jgi:phospholipid/cholesterol/gamma-HCH transport system ATP-binding protein